MTVLLNIDTSIKRPCLTLAATMIEAHLGSGPSHSDVIRGLDLSRITILSHQWSNNDNAGEKRESRVKFPVDFDWHTWVAIQIKKGNLGNGVYNWRAPARCYVLW